MIKLAKPDSTSYIPEITEIFPYFFLTESVVATTNSLVFIHLLLAWIPGTLMVFLDSEKSFSYPST